MPITEFCSRIFEERTSLSSGHLKDSIEGNVRDVHVFDALTSEAKEEVLAQHLRGDVIAATSLGIGYCAEEAEKQWCELVKASGKEAPTGAQVLDLVSPEHYSPEPVISYLKDMSIDGVSRAETSDMEWGQSTFYDYCPVVFHACRTAAGMTQKEYLASIHGARDALTSMVEKFSEGRSSSFFYFTHDKRFMVKTVSDDEQETMVLILEKFCKHMATNPDTFINKIYGCHGIHMQSHAKPKMFLVMESVMWTGNSINYRFDLKGSWVDRTAYKKDEGKKRLEEEDGAGTVKKLMKDSDLKHIKFKVYTTQAEKTRMIAQITRDTALFQEHLPYGIMDYSLLLAEHRRSATQDCGHDEDTYICDGYVPLHRRTEGGLARVKQAGDAPGSVSIYYIGIIDILQLYDEAKMGENFAKGHLLCKGTHGISSVPPFEYRERYIKAMSDIFVAVDAPANESDVTIEVGS